MTSSSPPKGTARTLDAALRFWAAIAPESVALVHGPSSWTYAELDAKVGAIGVQLLRRGVGFLDRVVLVGDNTMPWVAAYLACLRIGAVVVPANNRLSPDQFRDQCRLLDARLVLHDEPHEHLVECVADSAVLDLSALVTSRREAALDMSAPITLTGDSPALISFTSGTTGHPKGAVLSHGALYQGSLTFADYLGTTSEDSTLVLVPLFHNTGFVDQLGHMIAVGGSTHLLTHYGTADALTELAKRPVSFMTAVPSILRLLMVADHANAAYAHARTVLFGGSPMPAAWTAELQSRWPHLRLVHGYGLTEFTSACSFLPPELVVSHAESVGRAAPGVRLRVMDSQGLDCAQGDIGEIWAAGPTRMTAYWRQPEETAAKLAGEWLRTGDLGYLDGDGLVWLTGRVDDVINRGGEKVLPSYVESCLADLPGVAEATVFGYSDPVLQQRVAAAVQPRPGLTFDPEAASQALSSRLPDYAIPERWVVYERLPKTASGKADRRQVAREFAETRSPAASAGKRPDSSTN